jgi:nucleoside-diphosphate-sugar epimerase
VISVACYNLAMPSKTLIIGCGYLGRRVARQWIARGDEISALTRSTDRAGELGAAGVVPLVGDVTARATLAGLPEVDTVLYAVGLDRQSGKSQRDVYVDGLANVIDELTGKVRRWIYISSTSVYGQDGGELVDESSACVPQSPNGQVCLEAERLLKTRVPQANILRLAGIYGPSRLVARVEALRAGTAPEGNPDAWLNLIHVTDAAAAVLACERHGAPGATYLVADGHPCRRRDYYSLLAALIGAPKGLASSARPGRDVTAADEEAVPVATGLNKRCQNRRLREELLLTLRYPTFRVGLPDALVMRE